MQYERTYIVAYRSFKKKQENFKVLSTELDVANNYSEFCDDASFYDWTMYLVDDTADFCDTVVSMAPLSFTDILFTVP